MAVSISTLAGHRCYCYRDDVGDGRHGMKQVAYLGQQSHPS